MKVICLILLVVIVLVSDDSLAAEYGSRSRSRSKASSREPIIKMPTTLADDVTLSAEASTRDGYSDTVAGYDDPSYAMVSTDPHHVDYIADNRLYYHRIPHERLVLGYQVIRSLNGLRPHLLESIRPYFPFYVDY